MTETWQLALIDSLRELMALSEEGTRPERARARLRRLQRRHPETELDLVWEEEPFDGSVHYDLLLHLAGQGTISLSFCPDRALPWPLRGAHRWSETSFVRVNSTVLNVEDVVGLLDFIWDEAPIIERLLNTCLVREALEREPIELSRAEIQAAMDAYRRAHRLYRADDTHAWLERRGLTHEKLARLAAEAATVAKLRQRVTADRVEGYFEAHRSDFESASLDEPTRTAIEKLLFEQWLAEGRRAASIEWCWGRADRTGEVAS